MEKEIVVTSENVVGVKKHFISKTKEFLTKIGKVDNIVLRSTHMTDVVVDEGTEEGVKSFDYEFTILVYEKTPQGLQLAQSSSTGLSSTDITTDAYIKIIEDMFPNDEEVEEIKKQQEAQARQQERAMKEAEDVAAKLANEGTEDINE